MNVSLVRNVICSALLLACLTACNTERAIGFTGSWDRGLPVWADDGSEIAGIETRIDDGIIFPPLQGWRGKVNPRFALFIQDEDGMPRFLNSKSIKGYAMAMHYMKQAGYITVSHLKQPEEIRSVIIYNMDGSERGRLSNEDLGNTRGPIAGLPSQDGRTIAVATWDIDYSTYDDGNYEVSYDVVFLDAANATSISSQSFTTSMKGQRPKLTWADDATLVISDMQTSSAFVKLDGTIEFEAPLDCLPNPASSRIRSSDNAQLIQGIDQIKVDYNVELPADLCR